MKGIDEYVNDGWKVSMQVSGISTRKKYFIFLFGHSTFDWDLVGEGNTFQEMLCDLIDCEKEFIKKYTVPHRERIEVNGAHVTGSR